MMFCAASIGGNMSAGDPSAGPSVRSGTGARPVGPLGLVSVLAALVVAAASAAYASSVSIDEPFTGATIGDPARWNASKRDAVGSEDVCLTARSSASTGITLGSGVLAGCTDPAIDTAGAGVLRLTRAIDGQATTFLYNTPLPLADGLDISFSLSMWGGGGADGISFFLKDGANTDDAPGAPGGALGYGLDGAIPGVRGGLVGIGFDRFGTFSGPDVASSCGTPGTPDPRGPGSAPNHVVVRGPDLSSGQAGSSGYCFVGSAAHDFMDGGVNATTRAGGARDVRIVIDEPSSADPKVRVYIGPTGALPTTPTLEVDQPAVLATTATIKFGLSASTGGVNNTHEVWGLRVGAAVHRVSSVVAAPPSLTCTPQDPPVGAVVTCTVTGGDPDIDILWLATAADGVIASTGVRLGTDGTGTFSFVVPRSALGLPIRVELVEWTTPLDVGVVAGAVPVVVSAGEGITSTYVFVLLAMVAAAGALLIGRWALR